MSEEDALRQTVANDNAIEVTDPEARAWNLLKAWRRIESSNSPTSFIPKEVLSLGISPESIQRELTELNELRTANGDTNEFQARRESLRQKIEGVQCFLDATSLLELAAPIGDLYYATLMATELKAPVLASRALCAFATQMEASESYRNYWELVVDACSRVMSLRDSATDPTARTILASVKQRAELHGWPSGKREIAVVLGDNEQMATYLKEMSLSEDFWERREAQRLAGQLGDIPRIRLWLDQLRSMTEEERRNILQCPDPDTISYGANDAIDSGQQECGEEILEMLISYREETGDFERALGYAMHLSDASRTSTLLAKIKSSNEPLKFASTVAEACAKTGENELGKRALQECLQEYRTRLYRGKMYEHTGGRNPQSLPYYASIAHRLGAKEVVHEILSELRTETYLLADALLASTKDEPTLRALVEPLKKEGQFSVISRIALALKDRTLMLEIAKLQGMDIQDALSDPDASLDAARLSERATQRAMMAKTLGGSSLYALERDFIALGRTLLSVEKA